MRNVVPSSAITNKVKVPHDQSRLLSELFLKSTKAVQEECDTELLVRQGSVPKNLKGELFRNGPGRFSMGTDRYAHPFDGDGMISKFTFSGASVHYKNRYVRTKEYNAELNEGRMLYRSFGTNIPGGVTKNALRTHFKNAANTNVVKHGGKLFALWEGGWPHALDPESLSTLQRFSFSGKLKNDFGFIDSLVNPELPFSAHPKIDPATGNLYNFGTVFGTKNKLIFYSVSPRGELLSRRYLDLQGLSFIHDFVITSQGYALFFCSPVHFNILSMITGFQSPAEGMHGNTKKNVRVLVFPLEGHEGPIKDTDISIFDLPYSFVFHHINAFEAGDEIIVYSSEMSDFPNAKQARQALEGKDILYPMTQLVRYAFNKKSKRVNLSPMAYNSFELPRIHENKIGKEFTEFFAASAENVEQFPFLNCIDRIKTDGQRVARTVLPRCLVGEPVLAGPNAEYVVTLVFNGETELSDLLILDAANLKVVCRMQLPHSQPVGLHGNWYPSN